jgi:hypothetical protein
MREATCAEAWTSSPDNSGHGRRRTSSIASSDAGDPSVASRVSMSPTAVFEDQGRHVALIRGALGVASVEQRTTTSATHMMNSASEGYSGVPSTARFIGARKPAASRARSIQKAPALASQARDSARRPPLSRRRPCVACASAARNHAKRLLATVGRCGALAPSQASRWRPRTIERALLLQPLPVRQLPPFRPSQDSNVCTCDLSHTDKAHCGLVFR